MIKKWCMITCVLTLFAVPVFAAEPAVEYEEKTVTVDGTSYTLEELSKRGEILSVLEKHESVAFEKVYSSEDGTEFGKEIYYFTKDAEGRLTGTVSFIQGEDSAYSTYLDGIMYGEFSYMPEALNMGVFVPADEWESAVDEGNSFWLYSEDEKITDAVMEDGKLVLTTELEYSLQDGTNIVNTSKRCLDPETMDVLSVETEETYKDLGQLMYNFTYSVEYDGEAPVQDSETDYVSAMQNPENPRTITFIANPGTDMESSRTVTVDKETTVMVFNREQRRCAIYEDEACTKEISSVKDLEGEEISVYLMTE